MRHTKRIVRSACRMCHGVCQVLVHLDGDRVVKVTGDPDSPISRGYLCPKGAASPELLYHPDRLTHPLRRWGNRGENKWKRISWDEAFDEIARRFTTIKAESGSEYVAIGQGTGRPLIEFTMRFANAFGTPNFVAPSHVCYAPRIAASKITLGQLPVTDVYGFGGKDPACMMIWGCNITQAGSADGMCGGTIERALKKVKKSIVVDPRRIKPAEGATHWLQLRPGTDGALALAMIHVIIKENLIDQDFVLNYTLGYEQLVEHVKAFTPEWAASITRVSSEKIIATARTYATTSPACILWGSATDASPASYQTARSLLILRAITGNIDCPGGDVLWVPPRGVHQKSIFMSPDQEGAKFLPPGKKDHAVTLGKFPLEKAVHPPTFWNSIVTGSPYRIRAMWIAASNPLLSHTHPLVIEKALRDHLEFTVVSEFFMTPTAALADIVLPSAMWLETDDIVNLHKIWCVLARRKVAQIGEVLDVREVIIQMARRLDLNEAFPWKNYPAYLEWSLKESGLTFDEFCDQGMLQGEMRYYKYKETGFDTPSGKFEIFSTLSRDMGLSPLPVYREPALSPVSSPKEAKQFPLILTTGVRAKVYFVSEGRQIKSLRKIIPDPLVEIHPATAQSLGIQNGDWVWIETCENRVQMRAKLFDGIAPDVVSAQHAWWFPEDGPPDYGWKKSNVNLLFGDRAGYDPETGSESLRSSLCKVYKIAKTAGLEIETENNDIKHDII
jgi:anaerobic selenocysteine-containing dehydrogenase